MLPIVNELEACTFALNKRIRARVSYLVKGPRQPKAVYAGGSLTGLDTVELGRFVQFRLLPLVGTFPYPPHELMLMSAAMLWIRPQILVEWGTNIGTSARVFYEVSQRYRLVTKIHSVDLPCESTHFENPGPHRGLLVRNCDVRLHEGDGVKIASGILANNPGVGALAFIDGDHSKESVLREGRTLWTLFRRLPILFHDTFVDPARPESNGPGLALKELLAELGIRPTLVEAGLGKPGMTLVIP